jgi:hypothetical protein
MIPAGIILKNCEGSSYYLSKYILKLHFSSELGFFLVIQKYQYCKTCSKCIVDLRHGKVFVTAILQVFPMKCIFQKMNRIGIFRVIYIL